MARSAVLLVVRGVALEALLAARVTLLVAVWLAALPTKMSPLEEVARFSVSTLSAAVPVMLSPLVPVRVLISEAVPL